MSWIIVLDSSAFTAAAIAGQANGRQLHDAGAAVIFDDLRRLPDLIARVGREVG